MKAQLYPSGCEDGLVVQLSRVPEVGRLSLRRLGKDGMLRVSLEELLPVVAEFVQAVIRVWQV